MPRILIVEDDLLIADLLAALLAAQGHEVCGIARTVATAVTLCRAHRPAYAIIDLRLADGGIGTDIAAELGSLEGLGILYASDQAGGVSLTDAHGVAFLAKPFRPADLLRAMAIVIEIVTSGGSALAHPSGFRLLRPKA